MRLRIQRYGASRGVEYGFSRSLTRKRLDVSLKNVRRAWTCCPASAAFARRSRSIPRGRGGFGGGGAKSASVRSRPASRSSTSSPRSVSSLTAMLPPAPEPMTMASNRRSMLFMDAPPALFEICVLVWGPDYRGGPGIWRKSSMIPCQARAASRRRSIACWRRTIPEARYSSRGPSYSLESDPR